MMLPSLAFLTFISTRIHGHHRRLLEDETSTCSRFMRGRRRRKAQVVACQSDSRRYRIQVLGSVTNIDAKEWDHDFVGPFGSPFLLHDWFRCLEVSGCAAMEHGWIPQHLAIWDDQERLLVTIIPMYIKTNSMGEFVFDHAWAQVAAYGGLRYYPKLLCAVPFTPAKGRRILTRTWDQSGVEDGSRRCELLQVAGQSLIQVCQSFGTSSVHINFCEADEVDVLKRMGFLHRRDLQYHFQNWNDVECRPWTSFDEFLSQFRSKKRIKLKRERRRVYEDERIDVDVLTGDDVAGDRVDEMFRIYKSTIDKMSWGQQYLNREFFRMLLQEAPAIKKYLCYLVATRRDSGEVVGGTINFVKESRFYGRYWGCLEEIPNLHFETSYYRAIEHCIDSGIRTMEAGAGGGDFKFTRGFQPEVTNSLHYIRNTALSLAIGRAIRAESESIDEGLSELGKVSPLRDQREKALREEQG